MSCLVAVQEDWSFLIKDITSCFFRKYAFLEKVFFCVASHPAEQMSFFKQLYYSCVIWICFYKAKCTCSFSSMCTFHQHDVLESGSAYPHTCIFYVWGLQGPIWTDSVKACGDYSHFVQADHYGPISYHFWQKMSLKRAFLTCLECFLKVICFWSLSLETCMCRVMNLFLVGYPWEF